VEPTIFQIKQLVSDGERGFPTAPVKPNLLKCKGRDKTGREEKKILKMQGYPTMCMKTKDNQK
jgi:hypothetical protein